MSSCAEGPQSASQTKVIDGEETSALPAVAPILRLVGNQVGSCTGTFLTDRTYLTAGHCVGALPDADEGSTCSVSEEEVEAFADGERSDEYCVATGEACQVYAVSDKDRSRFQNGKEITQSPVEGKGCYVSKNFYLGMEWWRKLQQKAQNAESPEKAQKATAAADNAARIMTSYDVAVVVFPEQTAQTVGVEPEDLLNLASTPVEEGDPIRVMGYGTNASIRSGGAGVKRVGTNSIERVEGGFIKIVGKPSQNDDDEDDGEQVIAGSGDSGGALIARDDSGNPVVAGVASVAGWEHRRTGEKRHVFDTSSEEIREVDVYKKVGITRYANVLSESSLELFDVAAGCTAGQNELISSADVPCADSIAP